jgi:hypothetical protein
MCYMYVWLGMVNSGGWCRTMCNVRRLVTVVRLMSGMFG